MQALVFDSRKHLKVLTPSRAFPLQQKVMANVKMHLKMTVMQDYKVFRAITLKTDSYVRNDSHLKIFGCAERLDIIGFVFMY